MIPEIPVEVGLVVRENGLGSVFCPEHNVEVKGREGRRHGRIGCGTPSGCNIFGTD